MEDTPVVAITTELQSVYEEEYSARETEWRELAGKYKAANILTVCNGHRFSHVLECGAGDGSILKFLNDAPLCETLSAIEISDSAIIRIAERNLGKLKEVKKFNGYAIPFKDKQFDMVYCSHVLEHVEHPRLLLRELERISKYQVFEIPLDYSIQVDRFSKHFLSYGHINVFTPALFKFLLKSEGFEIKSEHFAHMADEVLRFSWYRNLALKKTLFREFRIRVLYPIIRFLKKFCYGPARYHEFGYSSYTCLAEGGHEVKISTTGKLQ